MKKIFTCFVFFGLFTITAFSQEFSYGFKGGINYPLGGKVTMTTSGIGSSTGTFKASGNVSFEGGAFLQINFDKFFVRPEIVYSHIESEFDFPYKASSFLVERFTVPLLVGYNIYGPLDVYVGPVYSNILNATLQGEQTLNPIKVQDIPFNAQIGVKAEYGRFGIDVRYEHNFSSVGTQTLDLDRAFYGSNTATFEDSSQNLFMIGVIFKLGGPGLNEGRRQVCY